DARASDAAVLARAQGLIKSGEKTQAQEYLREHLASNPDDIAASELLADLAMGAGDYDKVIAICRAALEHAPDAAVIQLLLAKVAEREKRFQDVVAHARDALASDPESVPARTLMAKAYEALDRHGEAGAAWRDLAGRNDHLSLWWSAIQADSRAGNWERVL